ncbi:MAG: hypothetical protein JWQ07_123 [Ramlibacter sp.]|nr:hypothetical protein [Ramlibacter sp.]
MELPFEPIARRDLKFVSLNTTLEITLALSAPYRPSASPSLGPVACKVLDSDDPEFVREICGQDEFEVLEMALIHFRNYIRMLIESGAGTLLNKDGTPFVPSTNVGIYASFLENSSAKVTQAIHDRMGKPTP